MVKCADCGASMPADAGWCGQCYAPAAAMSGAAARQPGFGTFAAVAAPALPSMPASYPGPAGPAWPSPAGGYVAPASTLGPPGAGSGAPTAAGGGRMLDRRALIVVAISIGVGALALGLSWLIGRDDSLEPEAAIRYAIVITVAVYAIVAVLLASQVTPSVRLRWTEGSRWSGAAWGILCGGAVSLVLLGMVSSAKGRLSPDPRAVLMMSEGDFPHILATVLIFCVAAPLVEEVLFRGVLLESLRPRGTALALCVSGVAFAVWHLTPTAVIYYTLLGAALGFLYLRKGLVCSMAAHFAFNSVLVIAAISVVLSPGATRTLGTLSIHVPSGWRTMPHPTLPSSFALDSLELSGPSGSQLAVVSLPTPQAPSVAAAEQRLTSPTMNNLTPGLTVDADSVTSVDSPAGVLVKADLTYKGHAGVLVIVPHDGTSYELTFASGGSQKARRDFDKMLTSLHLS